MGQLPKSVGKFLVGWAMRGMERSHWQTTLACGMKREMSAFRVTCILLTLVGREKLLAPKKAAS